MKKTAIAVATLLASLGLLQLLSGAGAGAATTPTRTVTDLTFTEGFCSDAGAHCKMIGKDPTAYGARLVFKIPLTVDATKIGYEEGECVYLTKKSQSDFCMYDLHLADGTIAVQGTLPYAEKKSGVIPVTGGTGAYLGAYGTLTFPGGSFDYQLHVVTP